MKIVLCPPEWQLFQKVMRREWEDATYLIQRHVANYLKHKGHSLDYLAPLNLEQTIYTNDPENPTLAPLTWSNSLPFRVMSKGFWRVQKLLGIPYLNVFSNYRLYDACLRCLPGHDVVYERHALYKTGVAMACKRLRLPHVLFFEADEIFEHDIMGKPIPGLLRWRAAKMMQFNLLSADCIISVSEPGKAHLVDHLKIPAEKIVVFPNAVDTEIFKPDQETRTKVRSSLGAGNRPLIMFVGRFYIWHDTATLLRSFAQVSQDHPGAYLVMVGDGEHYHNMKTLADDLGISQNVKFTGLVAHAEVPDLVAAADIAVVPYPVIDRKLWMSPLKLFEFMASGSSIVASAVGQIVDVIQDGVNGLLVPAGDSAAMAAALNRMIADSQLRSRLGQQARQDAVHKYSWEQYILRLESVFQAVIAKKRVKPET